MNRREFLGNAFLAVSAQNDEQAALVTVDRDQPLGVIAPDFMGLGHRDFISAYSPIGDDEHGHYTAKPEYYGMLAFSLGGKGRLLKAEMDASAPDVKAYATQPNKGALTLTLINKRAGRAALTVVTGNHTQASRAAVTRLSGPAIDAKSGITLGGAEVTPAGTWKPMKPEVLQARNGQLEIELPAASAAIVEIR